MLGLNVPFLPPKHLDHAAEELLFKYSQWKGSPVRPPIDVENIAEGYCEIILEMADLKKLLGKSDALGATWFEDKRMCIDQSLEGKEGRFAFTVAHEIGHWVLHRPFYEMEKVTLPLIAFEPGGKPRPAVVCRSGDRNVRPEVQANYFAARILMPTPDVRAAMQVICGEELPAWEGLRKRFEANEIDEQLRSLAGSVIEQGGFSNVSNEAMRRRLYELKLVLDQAEVSGRLL